MVESESGDNEEIRMDLNLCNLQLQCFNTLGLEVFAILKHLTNGWLYVIYRIEQL